jgi:hypothetical protein
MRKHYDIGDKVAFARAVVKRLNYDKATGDARGVVVDVHRDKVNGDIVSVDFGPTWAQHDDGYTVRHVPAANLTKILANGVIHD